MTFNTKEYISTWTFMRVLQLGLGIYFFVQYIQSKDVLMLFFGGFMTYQAVFNVGCFSSKGCGVSNKSKEPFNDDMDVTFEEVK